MSGPVGSDPVGSGPVGSGPVGSDLAGGGGLRWPERASARAGLSREGARPLAKPELAGTDGQSQKRPPVRTGQAHHGSESPLPARGCPARLRWGLMQKPAITRADDGLTLLPAPSYPAPGSPDPGITGPRFPLALSSPRPPSPWRLHPTPASPGLVSPWPCLHPGRLHPGAFTRPRHPSGPAHPVSSFC